MSTIHDTTVDKSGYCTGYGSTFTATCKCGWTGRSQLHEFSAESDGYRHTDLMEASAKAEAWGAV